MSKRNWGIDQLKQADSQLKLDKVAKQVALTGKPRGINSLDIRSNYNDIFSTNCFEITHLTTKREIDPISMIGKLVENGWELVCSKNQYRIDSKEDKMVEANIVNREKKILINVEIEYKNEDDMKDDDDDLIIPMSDDILITAEGKIPYSHVLTVLHPYRQESDEVSKSIQQIAELVDTSCRTTKKGAAIGIISSSNNNYYVKEFSLENKTPKFLFPDLHYGEGFEKFNEELLQRLNTTTKGLILLHGEPGTGKTQYIRVLLKELAKINKSILYAPPSLSASLTDPEMIEFISDWVLDEERDCILLIEDAEPLLETRAGSDGRSTGISNLLNMTDGILNDILGLTVIATFNTPISKIDPALLRPQRLTARKEFKKMPRESFVKLAEALKIELPDITYPASLAEFYSANLDTKVLIHDVIEPTTIGFGRGYR
jgi:hypothetical protein